MFRALNDFLEETPNVHVNTTVNKRDVIIKILKHVIIHRSSKSELVAFSKLINDILKVKLLPETSYYIDKFFNPDVCIKYHSVCMKCRSYIGTFERGQPHIDCSKCKCRITLGDNPGNFFVTLDPNADIKNLLKKNNLYYKELVEKRKHKLNVLKDFFDGKKYRKYVSKLPKDKKNFYITCKFNSDGSLTFNSCTLSIWPINLFINELPINERYRSVITCALWFGRSKPIMNAFLTPFVEEFNRLSEDGI